MIELTGKNGFRAVIDPDKITAYGIDPPGERRLWIQADGREFSVSDDVDSQFNRVAEATKGFNGAKRIEGLKSG